MWKLQKNINNLLLQRVVDLERQCWANAQYLRRECPEVVGTPCSVDDISLEKKVIQVFEKVSCNIDTSYIEACHRITKRNCRVIVTFSRRKDFQQVPSVKKNLQKLKWKTLVWLVITKLLLIIVACLLPCTLVKMKDPSQYGEIH